MSKQIKENEKYIVENPVKEEEFSEDEEIKLAV